MRSNPTRPKRTVQVGGLLQKEIAELLVRKIKDPRLEMVTITGVEVSPDLKQARIYFSRFGTPVEIQQGLEGLQRAAGFLKRELGQRLKLRRVPELEFVHDPSFDYGDRIESLLKELYPGKEPMES
jgi:ribosome-binding factor A